MGAAWLELASDALYALAPMLPFLWAQHVTLVMGAVCFLWALYAFYRHQEHALKQRCTFSSTTFSSAQLSSMGVTYTKTSKVVVLRTLNHAREAPNTMGYRSLYLAAEHIMVTSRRYTAM